MFAVITGASSGYRDRTITLVDAQSKGKLADPLDRFNTDEKAAVLVLDKVKSDLDSQYELRGHAADFLFFSILHHAVDEMFPIVRAYSYRMTKLKARLDAEESFLPSNVLNEVSNMALELAELRQWIGQMLGIFVHLYDDQKQLAKSQGDTNAKQYFGAGETSEDLRMHLLDTKDNLQQLDDRLTQLEKMATSFAKDHERHRDNRMNNTLFLLTVSTFVFMPMQILAGVYGMNFVNDDGSPSIPELHWKHGYLYFWLASLGIVGVEICFVLLCCNMFRCRK